MKKTFVVLIVGLFFSISIQAQSIVGKWILTSIIVESDMAYAINEPISLSLDENGKFSGNGGCNDYVGFYSFKIPKKSSAKPQKIGFTDVIFCSVKKNCPMTSNTETAFFRSLKEAATVVFERGELVIKSKAIFVKSGRGSTLIQNTMTFTREGTP